MGNKNDGNDKDGKVIRLDLSRTARAFEEKESLWDNEIGRMLKLIGNHVKTLGVLQYKDIDKEKKPLLSIGIFGSPGSGKTSLLQTFVNKARSDDPKDDPKKEFVQIESLPVIRPNNVAKDDHFLYAFLANALKEDRDMNESGSDKFRDPPVLSPLQQSFQEVSQYLQVINPAEESQEDDPLGKSLERLERHESGILLIEKMAAFIEELVKIKTGEKKSAVVLLPVDDVDMSLEILVSALDTYWRYLKHPQLVPVFTFTGRLAEELLRVHYESKLTLKGSLDSSQELKESATSLKLTENMAIQYLGRLFPVRNRIRVGLAGGRVLRAKYTKSISPKYDTGQKESNKQEPKKVLDLLETVSRLLFGHSGSFAPKIRAPLRMVTLRRQIQIVDAMQEAGINELIKKIKEENSTHEKSWAELFDLGTWTLLNSHRDIMREINMYLDDLYSWTPKGLRLVLRESILSLDLKKRCKLLTKWRYRTEGRRTQMLSLLAANTFRPWMKGIEPTGDDLDEIYKSVNDTGETKSKNLVELEGKIGPISVKTTVTEMTPDSPITDTEDKYLLSFPVRKAVIWFLDLCIGFYLPLIVACNFPDNSKENKKDDPKDEKEKDTSAKSITGIGWDFTSGPLHAIREAVYNKDRFFSGMLFIKCKTMIEVIKKIKGTKEFGEKIEEKGKYEEKLRNYKKILVEEILEQLKGKDSKDFKELIEKEISEILKKKEIKKEKKEFLEKFNKVIEKELEEKDLGKPTQEYLEKMGKEVLDKLKEGILLKIKECNNELKNMECYSKCHSNFLIYLFCYYGYDGEGSWAAVSFWRVLGLIGQLLELKPINQHDNKYSKEDRMKDIIAILDNHLKANQVIGHPPKRGELEKEVLRADFKIEIKQKQIYEAFSEYLAIEIEEWLDKKEDEPHKIEKHKIEKLNEPLYPLRKSENWETCFIRRLHGENLLSDLWRNLDNVYFEIQDMYEPEDEDKEKKEEKAIIIKNLNIDVETVIEKWVTVLSDYWDCRTNKTNEDDKKNNTFMVQEVLMECPILKHIMSKESNKNKPAEEVER